MYISSKLGRQICFRKLVYFANPWGICLNDGAFVYIQIFTVIYVWLDTGAPVSSSLRVEVRGMHGLHKDGVQFPRRAWQIQEL